MLEVNQDELRRVLKDSSLQVVLNSSWGKENSDYQIKIKTALASFPFTTSSISHTQHLGGFAGLVAKKKKIGFDVEVINRVKQQIAERVQSHPDELSEAPSPAHLWTAKESTFKALKDFFQPNTIVELQIGNWVKATSQIETFSLLNTKNYGIGFNLGLTSRLENHIFAVFICSP